MAVKEDNILLGSGDLYLGQVDLNATEKEIENALVNVGAISGGATLSYKAKFTDVKSANRGTLISFLTDEEVTFKSGVLTWNLENLSKLYPAKFTSDTTKKRIGIGGIKNVPINYLRFVHTKPNGKKLILNIFKAQAQDGFDITFDSEKETVLDVEFKALAVTNKTDGNLVEIIEEL